MGEHQTPLSAAIPVIHVTFLYCDEGKEQRRFQAICTAIPREGELVAPEAGSKRVIVHAVAYRIVFLRELTQEEERKYCIITKS
jgi:hypothetical protein